MKTIEEKDGKGNTSFEKLLVFLQKSKTIDNEAVNSIISDIKGRDVQGIRMQDDRGSSKEDGENSFVSGSYDTSKSRNGENPSKSRALHSIVRITGYGDYEINGDTDVHYAGKIVAGVARSQFGKSIKRHSPFENDGILCKEPTELKALEEKKVLTKRKNQSPQT